ncbi:MAG: hypothetical protein BBJ57_02250 [Desulfobacterales bacterium PC51MH44]|nr:MAG: hypothetical protein BBJ57_02250 [Desulfobacterales bacterium PC51MH44]
MPLQLPAKAKDPDEFYEMMAQSRQDLVKSVMKYLKGNLMGRPPEGQWFNRKQGDEGIYAEPNYNMELGEVEGFHGGGMFSKFSDNFMKTGTGGHVFGWGHYISEEKGVGKYYKDLYAKEHKQKTFEIAGEKFTGMKDVRKAFVEKFRDKHDLPDDVLDNIAYFSYKYDDIGARGIAKAIAPEGHKDFGKILGAVNDLRMSTDVTTSAAVYKVKLFKGKDPSEYTFLDWDKPISKAKSDKINQALRKEKLGQSIQKLREEKIGEQSLYDVVGPANYQGATGGEFYRDLAANIGDKEASQFLDRAGISGIRFPVGSLSGFTDKGKKNYVIFDPKNIEILEGPGKNVLLSPGYPKRK